MFLLITQRSNYSDAGQLPLSLVLLVGILFQSGGFFIHMLVGEEGAGSIGTTLTMIGAVLLAVALIGLAVGLLRKVDTASDATKGT